jgi:hypothetical protein
LVGRGCISRWALALALVGLGVLGVVAMTASAQNNRQTDLLSIGPSGGNGNFHAQPGGTSDDGTHVFFTTSETLTSDDTDGGYQDLYERFNGTTTLVSTGPPGGSAAEDAFFKGNSADGSHVFFETNESLVSTDTDSFQDVYDRSGGTTTEISIGPVGGNGSQDAFFVSNTTDGSKAYFESYEQITSNDNDAGYRDVYVRSGSTTSLVSTGSIGGSGNFGAQLDSITPDGSHTYFHTNEALVAADTDGGLQDIYDRSGGVTTLISTGPTGGNPANNAFFGTAAQDGSHVFFTTAEKLTSSDTDATRDAYDRSGGITTLISTGPNGGNGPYNVTLGGSTTDGSRVWFNTREPLVSGDTDSGCQEGVQTVPCMDVYERSGGKTTWISSGGNGSNDAMFNGASQNGSRVFFQTTESLSPTDTDSAQDIYERSGGNTTPISTGGNGPHPAYFADISTDGARVFFYTFESLVPADNDNTSNDVYEHYGGENTLLSTGPASTNEETPAFFTSAIPDGTKVFFFTAEKLTGGDTDSNVDVYSATTLPSPGFARPKGATPVLFALVPAYQQCTGPGNRTHGPPFADPACNPPAQTSGVLTVGTGDANGFTPQSSSTARYNVAPGDLQVVVKINDVRCQATNAACPGGFGSAYTGTLLVSTQIQATDRYNGSPPVEAATTQDFDIDVPAACAFVSSTIGGACDLTTTVNALSPGAVSAGKRTIWQFDDFTVMDAGANGTGYGAGCPPTCGDGDETVFMRGGIWVP